MSNIIKVSIVTPSFNQGKFIEETILSVLNQSYKNIQYIIVDGGSTDNTMEIIDKYRDRIDIIIHEKDKGQSDAINKGFKLADGELIGWINSDDILYPECVERIVELYENNPEGVIFYNSNGRMINEIGNILRDYSTKIPNREHLIRNKYSLIQQGSFYRRDIVEKVNYLDENIHYCMDLDLWLKLSQYGEIHYLNHSPLAAFRVWEATKTTTGARKFLKDIRRVLFKNGASVYDNTIRTTYWYSIKAQVKTLIRGEG